LSILTAYIQLFITQTLIPFLVWISFRSMREQTIAGLRKIFGCTRIQHQQNVSGGTKLTKAITTVAM